MKMVYSLKFKLLLLFFILIITPFIITGTITYNKYISSMESKTKDYHKQLTSQISINFDNYLNDIYNLLMVYFSDKNVMETMDKHKAAGRDANFVLSSEISTMYSSLSTIVHNRSEIKGIFVFCSDGAVFSNTPRNGDYDKALTDYWNGYRPETDSKMRVIPPHMAGYYSNGEEFVFSVMRTVKSQYDGTFIGMIKVDIAAEVFERVVLASNSTEAGDIIIADEGGNVFYPVDLWGKKYNGVDSRRRFIGKEYMELVHTSPATPIKVIGLFRKGELVDDANSLMAYIALVSAISLIVSLVISIEASHRLVKPIRHLMGKMRQVCDGQLWIKAEVMTKDELGLLSGGFNTMVERIRELLLEVGVLSKEMYEIKIRKRNAELSALQSQLNPHFLYNTLELLNMIALENNQFEICKVTANLGKLLRYTVGKEQKPVQLKEEIKFVDAYLQIYSVRLGEKLDTEIIADPDMMGCLVPKLIIQPLIENAIKHGLSEDRGRIEVLVYCKDEQIVVEVSDNGIGIDPEKLKKVKSRIYEEDNGNMEEEFEQKGSRNALRNVHRRIQLLYGEAYGLSVESSENVGSTFILRLPVVNKEV